MPRPKVALLSLGCAKNLIDSEQIASVLEANGVQVVHRIDGAPVAIVNTCGFIDSAKEESIDTILQVAEEGGEGDRPFTLIVTGCLSERYGQELRAEMPEVDAFLGIDPAEAAREALKALDLRPGPGQRFPRTRSLTPEAWTYLRISRGCDNRCAYCAIPLIRGPLRSRPREQVLEEARRLAERGVREVNVIGQDTSAYGRDRGGPELHELLRELCTIDHLRRVRVLYVHPAHLYDELLDTIAGEEKICPYLDMPLQHVNDDILARMGRRSSRAEIEELLGRTRERISDLTLRTTFIVGFPGETEREFEELREFVRAQRFQRVGCFAYSQEEDTRAAEMEPQVPQEVRRRRRDALMAAQQPIAFQHAEDRVGEQCTLLVEEGGAPQEGVYPARSVHEAPDVDPVIYLNSDRELRPGRFVAARIVAAEGYDCVAVDLEGEGE